MQKDSKDTAKSAEAVDPDGAVVELRIVNDSINAFAKAFDANGNEIPMPSRIEVRPQFLTATARVNLSRVRVFISRSGKRSHRGTFMLRLSGVTGRAVVEDVAANLLPRFIAEATPAEKPAEAGTDPAPGL